MKNQIIVIVLIVVSTIGKSQIASDLFSNSEYRVSWLGIDYSHVKLIGDFSQFSSAGLTGSEEIRNKYFPSWNKLIITEPNKYDIKGMLRLTDIYYDLDMVMYLNSKTLINKLEAYNTPKYAFQDIERFVKLYDFKDGQGIGIVFIAESLNKGAREAYYHFVAINMRTNEVLIHERLRGEPKGFGLRNYWAGSIYSVIKHIKGVQYSNWKYQYK